MQGCQKAHVADDGSKQKSKTRAGYLRSGTASRCKQTKTPLAGVNEKQRFFFSTTIPGVFFVGTVHIDDYTTTSKRIYCVINDLFLDFFRPLCYFPIVPVLMKTDKYSELFILFFVFLASAWEKVEGDRSGATVGGSQDVKLPLQQSASRRPCFISWCLPRLPP